MQISTLLCQCPEEVAKEIGRVLVEAGLAACVDILSEVQISKTPFSFDKNSIIIVITYDIYIEDIPNCITGHFGKEIFFVLADMDAYRPLSTESNFSNALKYYGE